MTALSASRSAARDSDGPPPDARTAYLYLLPAFVVMGVITFYPLLFQTYMSFTDFGLRNLRGGPRPRRRPRQLRPDPHEPARIPNFEFLRLVLLQHLVGVLERRHPRDHRRADRRSS